MPLNNQDHHSATCRLTGFLKALLLVLAAIIFSYGMQMNINMTVTPDGTMERFPENSLGYIIRFLQLSTGRYDNFSIHVELLALVMIIMSFSVKRFHCNKREYISAAVFSALFSFCVWAGQVFSFGESWKDCFAAKCYSVRSWLFIISYFYGSFLISIFIIGALKNIAGRIDSPSEEKMSVKRVLKYAGCLLLFWMPLYIIFWPGYLHGDLANQIMQYLSAFHYHFPVRFMGAWVTDGKTVLFTNDHPVIQTLLVGAFMDLGHSLGNNNLGYGMLSFFQMVGYALLVGLFLTSMEHFGTRKIIIWSLLAVFIVVPPYYIFLLSLSGDIFFTFFFLCFQLVLYWICQTNGEWFKKKRNLLLTGTAVFFVSIAKNQGLYIALAMAVIILIAYRKYWKRILLSMFVPFLVFHFLYTGLFFKAMKVESVGKQEALSLVFQQTARTVKNHQDEITEEEKRAISAVLEYDTMAERYDPDLSDPVKGRYNREATSQDMNNYFSTWFKMGLKYPVDYIQSVLDSSWGYYYPLVQSEDPHVYWSNHNLTWLKGEKEWMSDPTTPQGIAEEYDTYPPESRENLRQLCRTYGKCLLTMPVLALFSYPGTVFWIGILCMLILWTRKDYKDILCFFSLFLVLGICVLSPKNNNYRYMLPASYMLPFLLGWTIERGLKVPGTFSPRKRKESSISDPATFSKISVNDTQKGEGNG